MGNEALALASDLSSGAPQASGSRIFFDIAQRVFIQMPVVVGAAILLLLLFGFAAVSWKRGSFARGAATTIAMLVGGGVAAWLAITIIGLVRAGTYWRADPEITFLTIYATILLGELAVLRTIGAEVETRKLRAIYWLVFLLLGGALALVAPGGIIYFLLPPAVAQLGVLISRWYAPAERIGGLLAFLLLFVTWGELLAALEQLFSPGPLWTVVPIAAIVIAPALIEAQVLFAGASRRALLVGSAAIALLGWIVAGTAPAYSQDHQQRFTIEHLTEFPSGKSSWSVLNDGAALPAAYSAVGPRHRGKLDFSARERWFAPAPAVPGIRPVDIQTLSTIGKGDDRTGRFRLKANGAERISLIAPEGVHIRAAGVSGFVRAIDDQASSGKFTITCTGRSCDGAELVIEIAGKPASFTISGARNGLLPSAGALLRGRPGSARPQYVPDETLTVTHVTL